MPEIDPNNEYATVEEALWALLSAQRAVVQPFGVDWVANPPARPAGPQPVTWYTYEDLSPGSAFLTAMSGVVNPDVDRFEDIPEPDEPVGDVAPAITNAGTISGTPDVGNTLSVTGFTATGSPTPTLTYQWQRDTGSGFSAISGATSATYALVEADEGHDVRRQTTATNSEGSATGQTSAVTVSAAPVPGELSVEWLDGGADVYGGLSHMAQNSGGTGAITASGDPVGWSENVA